jgi:beta-galactosidase
MGFSSSAFTSCLIGAMLVFAPDAGLAAVPDGPRERMAFNDNWLFAKGDPAGIGDTLSYTNVKAWMAATGAEFTTNSQAMVKPEGNPGINVPFAQADFADAAWRKLILPHDWAIEGPFKKELSGGMGRLQSWGPVWYRKHFDIPAADAGRRFFLQIDGAMSYAMVWLNGQFVGGWPYGYMSFELELTPFIKTGGENVLAIRLDSPPNSSRWYPGAGIYRNVWLLKTGPVHVAHWGTFVITPEANRDRATIQLKVSVENSSGSECALTARTEFFALNADGQKSKRPTAATEVDGLKITANATATAGFDAVIKKPRLWSLEQPNRYVAVTTLERDGKILDSYETPFGIRTIQFTATNGFLLNGRRVPLHGVCLHHDLGALGSAVNVRALQRQLETLRAIGCNAIRTSHNPPAPELLDLCDRMGLLVLDEAFDCWARQKNSGDYHLLFNEWHEKDLRALIRRDRNHPCVVMWSIGNEVGEQNRGEDGAAMARELNAIAHEEDPTRPATSAMNSARAASPFPAALDVLGLNYQGAGVRAAPPQYPVFHQIYPAKFVFGSETASTVSSRGVYTFPVATGTGAVASASSGEDVAAHQISSYDLNFPDYAAAPDKEFAAEDRNPFVGGEFVWTGWDYLGEPTPWGRGYDPARSSYYGIIDLAGFPKDRYYLYQARWRPDFPMAHILPHWNWPERVGQVTPVHVYTSGDEAELFLNGKSLGRKVKGQYEYRLRWDDVKYEPGTLRVVAYKHGKKWATDMVKTAGPAAGLRLQPDRATIQADGKDLSFITVTVADKDGLPVPGAMNHIVFEIEGPGEIVATDNGDPTSLESFQAPERDAFNGLALVIVRGKAGEAGKIKLTAQSAGLKPCSVVIKMKRAG